MKQEPTQTRTCGWKDSRPPSAGGSQNVNTALVDGRCVPQNLRQASVYRPRFVSAPLGVFRRGYSAPPARPTSIAPGWYRTCPARR